MRRPEDRESAPRARAGAAVVTVIAFVSALCLAPPGIHARETDTFAVQRVVDGDTVIVETIGRVRLICVLYR